MSNLKYWLWLTGRKGLAGQVGMRVLEHFGSPERVYFSHKEDYHMVGGLSENTIRSLEDKSMDAANRILGECDRLGIRLITMQDAAYPERLAAIHQPPMVLYMKGRPISFDEEAAIAIVGTRGATPYGVCVASQLAMDLTRNGALIVSGIAEGIDGAAVRAALSAGGPVVSVLAGGIDVVYPKEHRKLYEDIASVGALISEHPPGTPHHGSHFPIRNRIISGLSAGVIVVESKRYGGSMHTVAHALDQDREVFAVPGPIGSVESEGTNRLIQEGAAKLIMSAEDVICELIDRFPDRLTRRAPMTQDAVAQRMTEVTENVIVKDKTTAAAPKKEIDNEPSVEYIDWQDCKMKLTNDQQAVLLAFGEQKLRVDELVEKTQMAARRILSALTILQVQGLVEEESGKRFRAVVRLKME